jgi:hypothetical protein
MPTVQVPLDEPSSRDSNAPANPEKCHEPRTALVPVFSLAVFLSALLMFLIEPMVGKMFLPLLGGSPSVWNTCMLFFQVSLLAGYFFAHLLTRHRRLAPQFVTFALLLAASLAALPVAVGDVVPPGIRNPVGWLLLRLVVAVGLPFFVLSTISPLLQRWFSLTDHPGASDPYFLYVASNAGSLAALVAYPVLIEPQFGLATQSRLWAVAYWVLAALLISCLLLAGKGHVPDQGAETAPGTTAPDSPTRRTRVFWLLAAFLPSSLMLAATTAITTDIAAVPFMWVLPLGLYLVTLILSFMTRPPVPHSWVIRLLPLAVVSILLGIVFKESNRWIGLSAHMVLVLLAGLFCHRELALRRPDRRYLTEFYLWLSAGGALGGVFNAIVAPLVFSSVIEYPLIVLIVILFCANTVLGQKRSTWDGILSGAGLAAGLIAALFLLGSEFYGVRGSTTAVALIFVLPLLAAWLFHGAGRRVTLGVLGLQGVLFVVLTSQPTNLLGVERNFFGVKRVRLTFSGRFHTLEHGDINHGVQRVDPAMRREPLAYFYRTGPLGDIFRAAESEPGFLRRVAVLGLGIGSMAAYGHPHQEFDFYEIDPAVEELARDPRYFTFLADCRAEVTVFLGDGRLRLRGAPDSHYQLIIADAFSSDSVPAHLLSLQAMQLMLRKTSDTGLLVFNISNRYLDLRPVLANSAAELGLVCYVRRKDDVTLEDQVEGKYPCWYLVIARRVSDLRGLDRLPGWQVGRADPRVGLWTDDYSSLFRVLKLD